MDIGEVPGSRQYTNGPGFAVVLSSLAVQAEWAGQFLTAAEPSGQPQGAAFYYGGYAEVLYFLTGETQPYEKRQGTFGRVVPNRDFHCKRGTTPVAPRGRGRWACASATWT